MDGLTVYVIVSSVVMVYFIWLSRHKFGGGGR